MSFKFITSVILMSFAAGVFAHAQDPLNRDEDFQFQGEYVGSLSLEPGRRVVVGLQVVARGEGKFVAVLYRGGLPGAGWNMESRTALTGQRDGNVLTLTGGNHTVKINGGFDGTHSFDGGSPGRLRKTNHRSPTLGSAPTYGATVLFDGAINRFRHHRDSNKPATTSGGLLHQGAVTEMPVGDFYLHIEFRTPYMPTKTGQQRGNSGVYIQRRYEVQILDSFGLTGAANECGGLYRTRRPDVNMCLPPLSWQTYDVYFNAARFDAGGNKLANARLTVLHNDHPIHLDIELPNKTGAGRKEGPEKLEILLQDHGNPVRFRNIWFATRDEYVLGPIVAPPPPRSYYEYYQQKVPWPFYRGRPPFPYPPYLGLESY